MWQQGGGKAARAQLPSLGHATAMAGAREVWLGLQVLPGEDSGAQVLPGEDLGAQVLPGEDSGAQVLSALLWGLTGQ